MSNRSAAQIAQWDQAYAKALDGLDLLIAEARGGDPMDVIAQLTLGAGMNPAPYVAAMLGVAVVRLAQQQEVPDA